MTVKRINHTGRRKILQDDISIVVTDNGPRASRFSADIALVDYKLPNDAAVFVDAYGLSLFQRFSFGVVGDYSAPDDLTLTSFDSIESVKFRVKVVEQSDGRKRILAEADQISPRSEEGEQLGSSMLPVRPSMDLGDVVFKVEMADSPVLLVNASVGDWRAVSASSMFVSLVYPAVFQQILTEILLVQKHDDVEDDDDWRSRWLRFGRSMPNTSELPKVEDSIEIRDWIDSVVESFTRLHTTLSKFKHGWLGS